MNWERNCGFDCLLSLHWYIPACFQSRLMKPSRKSYIRLLRLISASSSQNYHVPILPLLIMLERWFEFPLLFSSRLNVGLLLFAVFLGLIDSRSYDFSLERFNTNLINFWTRTKTMSSQNIRTCWVLPNVLLQQAFSLYFLRRQPSPRSSHLLVLVLRYVIVIFPFSMNICVWSDTQWSLTYVTFWCSFNCNNWWKH